MKKYINKDARWLIENKDNEYQSKLIDSYRHQLSEYFKQYNYHWFVTLNLHQYDVEDCERFLKIWTRNMCVQHHIRISYIGVIVTSLYKGNHVHLLMMGKNQYGETLLDRDKSLWEREWDYIITHRPSPRYTNKQLKERRIAWNKRWTKPYHSKIKLALTEPVAGYISCYRNTPINYSESFELLTPYNKKLLEKYEKKIIHN